MLDKIIFQDCERDPASKSGPAAEQLSKCKASLAEFEAAVKNMDTLKFANSMKVEAEFKGGDGLQLFAHVRSYDCLMFQFKLNSTFEVWATN